MRLVGALDAVLAVVAFSRKQLRDLVDAADPAAAIRPGRKMDGLADLEFVFAQGVLQWCRMCCRTCCRKGSPSAVTTDSDTSSPEGFMTDATTERRGGVAELQNIVTAETPDFSELLHPRPQRDLGGPSAAGLLD